jgi:hypothetical protein
MVAPGMPFTNPIVGGGNLVIPFIQSPNFVPGVSGWRISRNGDAEFASQTLRGPLIVIDPNTGLVVASISNTGNIAGQYASIENDIILQGQSLGDRLLDGRGLVGFFGTFGNPPAPGVGSFTDMAWFRAPLQGNRLYFINFTPLQVNHSSVGNEEITHHWIVTGTDGTGPATYAQVTQTIQNSPAKLALVQGFLYAFSSDPTAFNTTTFQLRSSTTDTGITYTAGATGWNLYCWDVGPLTGAMNNGGLGTAAGATQRTTQYNATLSRSYNGSGNQIVGTTDLWRSDFGDGNGATTSLCIFPGATIRSDLTGATVQSATLSMYCTTAEESNGSIAFDGDPATSLPATQATFTGGTHVESDAFPNPGWYTFDITGVGSFLTDILAGDNAMKISAAIFGLAATRFAGASVANRPYITITYTK